jgi:hypothetical protein
VRGRATLVPDGEISMNNFVAKGSSTLPDIFLLFSVSLFFLLPFSSPTGNQAQKNGGIDPANPFALAPCAPHAGATLVPDDAILVP